MRGWLAVAPLLACPAVVMPHACAAGLAEAGFWLVPTYLAMQAGSNRWYQAYVLKESRTEVLLLFPRTKRTREIREWVAKTSRWAGGCPCLGASAGCWNRVGRPGYWGMRCQLQGVGCATALLLAAAADVGGGGQC